MTQRGWLRALVEQTHGGSDALVRALAEELERALGEHAEPGVRVRRILLTDGPEAALDAVLVARAPFTRWFALGEVARSVVQSKVGVLGERDGAEVLLSCGPPWGYLRSGLPAANGALCDAWRAHGFGDATSHVDLVARPRGERATRGGVSVERVGERDAAVVAWVREHFGFAWAVEAARGQALGGLFVARSESGEVAGFCAHSGHNAAAGTFGPLGVAERARGGGLGGALAARALGDLRARGFDTVTIPWTEPRLVRFYAAHVEELRVVDRVILRRMAGRRA